jgi:condensin complex subunit 3
MTNTITGEEKKSLTPLLAKLHISPASTPSLLKEIYTEVTIAIEDKLIADATGRNALYKIHVSLGKIANSLKDDGDELEVLRASTRSRKSSVAPSVVDEREADEEKTELVKVEEGEEESEGTMVGDGDVTVTETARRDSLVEELLSDGDVEMSGI